MALVLANRVQETSTTTGTGTLTLAGAVTGYQTFAAGIGSGNTCYYAITSGTGEWEVGIGTVGTGTLARTTLLSSSTGSLVSFTGTLNVFVTYPSEKSVNLDASGVVTGYPITIKDNVFTLQDDADPTKQAQFQLSSLTTGVTFSYVLPLGNGSASNLVDQQSTQTLTGIKTFSGGVTFSAASGSYGTNANASTYNFASGATTTGLTKTVNFGTGGLSGSTTTIAIGSSVSGATSTTTMNGVTNFLDTGFTLQDDADTTKKAQFQLSGITTGNTRTYTLPDISSTVAVTSLGQTFTGVQTFAAANGNFVTGVTTGTTNLGSGANASGVAKFVNLGTGGLTGSTTAIVIGSTFGTTTTVNGTTYLGGASGTQSFEVDNVASAVNWVQAAGAATGAAPTLSAQGSDAAVGLNITSKSFGAVNINTGTGTVAKFQDRGTSTVDSGFIFRAGTAGAAAGVMTLPVSVSIQIPDNQFSFKTNSATTGANSGTLQFAINHTASAVNYLQVTGAVTTGAPEISAQGSDTNINLKLTPKGTGGVSHTGTAFTPNFNLTDAATIAWDTTTAGGQVATFTFVSSNRTMGAPTNLINGAFYALAVIQNAGSNTLTWNTVFKWAAGTAPTLSTAAGAKDYFTFRSDGTNLYQQGISQAVA